jgi:hypothetical protein
MDFEFPIRKASSSVSAWFYLSVAKVKTLAGDRIAYIVKTSFECRDRRRTLGYR